VKRRLVATYLVLTVLILAVLEVPLATLAQRFERQLATEQVDREASGLIAVAADKLDDGQAGDLRSVVSDYQSRTGGEVAVLAASGAIIARSSVDGDDDEEEDWQGLVARAFQGQTASDFTTDEGEPYAVVASPVVTEAGVVAVVLLGAPASYTQQRIHEIWLALGVFAAAALVVATAAGYLLARSVVLPIAHLQATVERFGRGAREARAPEDRGPPDVRALAGRFNQMADRINELLVANTRFVADASHQLRSPLTALRLRIENLEARADPATGEDVAAVGRELARLSRIVDGLLALGRADQERPERQPVAIGPLVSERAEAWAALASEREVTLIATGPDRSARADLVAGDLEQILDNLLANALEATPAGGRIEVSAECAGDGGGVEIHVRDDGPGLDAESRARAFDRFWQGPAGTRGGSGLGLAIVRQLANRNGMEVELEENLPRGVDAVLRVPPPGR
jgi:signal transduction histidine kinase